MSLSVQDAWDLAAVIGAAISCGATLMRRHMLGGDGAAWHSASGLVQGSLSLQAIVTGAVAISLIFRAHHTSQVETLLLIVSAVVSATLALNLDRSGRKISRMMSGKIANPGDRAP